MVTAIFVTISLAMMCLKLLLIDELFNAARITFSNQHHPGSPDTPFQGWPENPPVSFL
jgi:hypothetical protein